MADKMIDEMDENIVVEFNDDNGNSLYYQQEMIIPVDGQDFALLVGLNVENDESFDEEENVIIAKRKAGATTLSRVDGEQLKLWLEEYSLGDLWIKDILQGGISHE